MSVTKQTGERMEQLERAVVFRTARGSFFLMAVIAVLTFAAGLVVGVLGYLKMPIGRPSEPPPIAEVSPPPPITYQQVEAWIAALEARKQAARAAPPPVYDDDDPGAPPGERSDPVADELRRLDGELRALFPNPPYVWDDVYETTCVNQTAYGCLREERRVKSEGLSHAVRAVLAGTSRADKAETLRLLVSVLGQAPVERRGALLGPIIQVNDEVMRGYRQQLAARERAVEDQQTSYQAALTAYREQIARRDHTKADQRRYGRYGIVAGLALLVLVSVFLVHFAMERHLRLIRELVDLQRRVDPRAAAVAVAGTPPPGADGGGAPAVARPFDLEAAQ